MTPQLGAEAAGGGILLGLSQISCTLAVTVRPPSQLPTAKSQDGCVHIPEELQDEAIPRMTSTFHFKLAHGDGHSSGQ